MLGNKLGHHNRGHAENLEISNSRNLNVLPSVVYHPILLDRAVSGARVVARLGYSGPLHF
jgi:hypothetical protein